MLIEYIFLRALQTLDTRRDKHLKFQYKLSNYFRKQIKYVS